MTKEEALIFCRSSLCVSTCFCNTVFTNELTLGIITATRDTVVKGKEKAEEEGKEARSNKSTYMILLIFMMIKKIAKCNSKCDDFCALVLSFVSISQRKRCRMHLSISFC